MLSRREFFKMAAAATAAGAAVITVPGALAATDPRAKAWDLLEQSRQLHTKSRRSAAYLRKTEELFAHMNRHFLPLRPENFGVDLIEVRLLLRHPESFSLENCSDTAFCVVIVRHGLKNLKLPMIQAGNWAAFARQFTNIIMAA